MGNWGELRVFSAPVARLRTFAAPQLPKLCSPQRRQSLQFPECSLLLARLRRALNIGLCVNRCRTAILSGTSPRRINVVFDFCWFERQSLDFIFKLSVSVSRALVLPLMFRPGIDEEGLQISIGGFGIVEHSPSSCTVATANPLIFVNHSEKLGREFWIDDVFNSYQNRPLIGFWFRKQGWFSPVVPTAQVKIRGGERQGKPQKHTSSDSDTGD